MNFLESPDAGSVKSDAIFENVAGEFSCRNGKVLPLTDEIRELEVNDLHGVVFDGLHDLFHL